ncbi:CopG family transcriptional regulator [Kovacikia minuta CCNUW1]|uniref:CopG family transcriptional regulator n=1 Tax=Kovacikia minuta TaxID=2931930 RepID=UPI001CCB511F|nr:CopG family transcriptional regulator [Kovacikia minuta]UBF29264.1 CopG family transcriptional regulator [Kovacikia minuta CCNUW1]
MEITTQLDETHAGKLAYIQQQTNLSLADVLEQAIDLYYQKLQQSADDPLAKLKQGHFIGRFKAAPDFATNSKAILQDLMQQHDHR